ncbi:MAG: hypothetical protein AB7P03_06425 [Kofleriaceae bacterium]
MSIDVGLATTSMTFESLDSKLSGWGANIAVLGGGTIADGVVVHGEIAVAVMNDPTLKGPNVDVTLVDTLGRVASIGAGMLWWFSDDGWYAGASVGGAQLDITFERNGTTYIGETQFGLTGKAEIGLKRRLSWFGLGVGLSVRYASMEDKDNTGTVSGYVLAASGSLGFF